MNKYALDEGKGGEESRTTENTSDEWETNRKPTTDFHIFQLTTAECSAGIFILICNWNQLFY